MADALFPLGEDTTPYRKISSDYVSVDTFKGQDVLSVEPEGLRLLAETAFADINHLLRPGHLKQLASILSDPEATDNDRFVAYDLLKNANIAAGGVLPMCQDTGTAIIMAKKGRRVWTEGGDEVALAKGVMDAYERKNLRYSQLAPLKMFEEKNTRTNLPAQIDIYEEGEDAYKFLFMAKGGGSANKTYLYQGTPSLLTHDRMIEFLKDKILSLGTAACPPYHLAIVIGGLSAEMNLKTVKLASARYLDSLPTEGSESGHAFRDLEMEQEIHKLTQSLGVGAQFGGKYFCHDVRVIRLPRHGASLPIGLGVSCSADRQALGKITKDGIYIEQLETDPSKYMPEIDETALSSSVVKIDLNQPMSAVLAELSKHPVKTRLSLTGTIIVARDLAHSKIRERLEKGEGMPEYRRHAGIPEEPPGLLCRPGEDPGRLCLRLFRPDDGRPHGQLCRPVPVLRWLHGHARQGQPLARRARGLQEARRLLSRLDRWPGGTPCPGLHQACRGSRISGTRHGGGMEDRSRRLPGLHRHRRQGQ